jgi:hypothetical protein
MENFPPILEQLLGHFASVIGSTPTAVSLLAVVVGWTLCNGRHTLSAIIRAAGPLAPKSHDAYQNFFSKSKWDMDVLWRVLFYLLVVTFCGALGECGITIWIAGDDTLVKHYGRKIWGAGLYRDAVRSSRKHVAYAWGLNWVVLAMIVKVPLLNERYIALPIMARLNPKTPQAKRQGKSNKAKKTKAKGKGSKRKKTTVAIMTEMVHTVAAWLPNAHFVFCGDGAYASVAKSLPENVHLVSRIRCDAALYALPGPRPKGKRGRNAKKGKRLLCPQQKARRVRKGKTYLLDMYGQSVERQLYSFVALWYEVCPDSLVKVVIVRDPEGKHDDEFFFSTDLEMSVEQIVLCYTGRWAIEVVFRESKQYLGISDPQARKKQAVLRLTPFCLWLDSLIKLWFILESRTGQPLLLDNDPWYTHKQTISFQDMIGALRHHFWRNFISAGSTSKENLAKITDFIVKSLSKAA